MPKNKTLACYEQINMKASDYIAQFLKLSCIDTVFGYQGGNITHVIDSVARLDGLRYIQSYHEQGAAFAACAYAQVRRSWGVAVASSGPGATNLITGIANAFFDSVPVIFLTGNVNSATMRPNSRIRQSAFQEADIVSMVKGITKYAVTIKQADQLPDTLLRAAREARSGRPGPVLLDLPHDIQRQNVKAPLTQPMGTLVAMGAIDHGKMLLIHDLLATAERPLVLAGGGLNQVPPGLAQNFLSSLSCPVVASLGGLDVLDHYDGKFLGLIGSFGQDAANKALETCDVLLVLGSRLAERQIEHRNISAKIIHVDIDPYELGRAVKEEISLHVCLETFLRMFQAPQNLTSRSACWAADLKQEQEGARELAADNIGLWFSEFIQPGDILCADVGLNQMGLARHIKLRSNRLLNSGGLGAMGYALPAAIGASYAAPEHRIWCFAGDGGIQMNIQELQTVAREGLPIKIVVVNNQSLGMIRKYHELAFAGRTVGSVQGYSAPDFGKLAKAYGLEYRQAADPEQLRQSLAALSSREAFLLEIVCRV